MLPLPSTTNLHGTRAVLFLRLCVNQKDEEIRILGANRRDAFSYHPRLIVKAGLAIAELRTIKAKPLGNLVDCNPSVPFFVSKK